MDGMKRMTNSPKTEAIIGDHVPEELTDDTQVLGVPVKEWNKTFVGNFEKTLAKQKQDVERSSAIDEKK